MPVEGVQPEVLSDILLIQNMLPSLPDPDVMLSFTCRGLESVPGIATVRYLLAGHHPPSPRFDNRREIAFPVHIGNTTYASVYCTVTDEAEFEPYHPYINNVCFIIAARIEEQRHRQLDDEYKKKLEDDVEARTTALKEAHLVADAERARAEKYLEIAETIVVELNREGRIDRINVRGAALLGFTVESLRGQDWFTIAVPSEIRMIRRACFDDLIRGKKESEEYRDYETLTREGDRRIIHWHTVLRRDSDGVIIGTLGLGQDVTERRNAEREKEILLKEVYHRTKNNMQVITSILALQAATAKEPAVRESIKEAQNRIASMALVHNMLYSSGTFARLQLKTYVTQLAENLLASYATRGEAIALDVGGHNPPVSLETAIPCGLVLNELITNSVKHAFEEAGATPCVSIALEQAGDEMIIEYRDNGTGFSEDPETVSTEGLGMRIIENVIREQLNGTLKLNGGNGVEVIIRIPVRTIES